MKPSPVRLFSTISTPRPSVAARISARKARAPAVVDMPNSEGAQIVALAGARRHEHLRPDRPCKLDRRQTDAPGSGVDQHPLARAAAPHSSNASAAVTNTLGTVAASAG